MKRLLIILAIILVGSSSVAFAKPVDKTTAANIAARLLAKDVVDATPAQMTECYLFVGNDGIGFVLLSADDCVRPLLGYSHEAPFIIEGMPSHIADWIKGYQQEISYAKSIGQPQSEAVAEEWNGLLKGTLQNRKTSSVQPLLTTKWSQQPFYNNACPYDSAGSGRSVTGCTATATSQIMRYWRHPVHGRGSHSYDAEQYGVLQVNYDSSYYDWDNMPIRLNSYSSPEQNAAVAKLCYEVGVSMNMHYTASGSGAYEHSGGMLSRFSAELGLENHFYYNPGMYFAFKDGYSDAEWVALIAHELDEGRPVLYTGTGPLTPHAFVVDGYDNDLRFHINWGWGGTCDGYFNLENLICRNYPNYGDLPFNEINGALIGMYPITPNDSLSTVALVSADPSRGTVSGSGTYSVSSDRVFLRAHPKPGYRFSHWASGNTANPIFYYPTIDYADTAYFVPLSTDTLAYCSNSVPNFDTVPTLAHAEWGIRIPTSLITAGSSLRAVENFVYTTGDYRLRIYLGEEPTTPVYDETLTLTCRDWRTSVLEQPIPLDATQPLWITFSTEGMLYTQAISPCTGVDDGSWVKTDEGWQHIDTTTVGYYTWAIRGLLQTPEGIVKTIGDGLSYSLQGLTLTVGNPDGRTVRLFDITGRLLSATDSQHPTLKLPSTGIYLLQADGCAARKIVAVK